VTAYATQLVVRPKRITIRDTSSRWGSCSSARSLSFSWRLILAPPAVLDYVVAHEVAHLRELNHKPRFWRLVDMLVPEIEKSQAWLSTHGALLHRYAPRTRPVE
jgi:predicted metal-dependent hydrolase